MSDPRVSESAFLAPGVVLYGDVTVGEHVSLWPGVVVRAECQDVQIGRMTNLQDHCLVHVGFDHPTRIGEFCSITHRAVVHGATIGDHCLIGIGAVIMDGAVIGSGSIVGGNALVPEGKVFPPDSIIVGVPARRVAERPSARENRLNAWVYRRNAVAYRRGEHRSWARPDFDAWRQAVAREIETDRDLALDPDRVVAAGVGERGRLEIES